MPSWIVPSDSHVPSDTGHTTDHNHIVDDLTLIANILTMLTGSGGAVFGVASGNAVIASTDGTATSNGAFIVNPATGFFGIYNSSVPAYYGIGKSIPLSAGEIGLGAFFSGMALQGSTNNTVSPIFAVLTSTQSSGGFGTGEAAFAVNDSNRIYTFNSTLDDGSGNMTVGAALTVTGIAQHNGGTDTSATATASSPTFVSGTAKQCSTTQDVTLYIAVQTAAALAVAIGPTSTPANTVMPSQSYALGLQTIRVPKGWYVKITGTIADLTITQVTC